MLPFRRRCSMLVRRERELPFRRRHSVFAVCPQHCLLSSMLGVWVVAHTLPPDVHIRVFALFQKICRDRTSCKSYTCCVASSVTCTCGERRTVQERGNETTRPTQNHRQKAQDQAQQVVNRRPPLSTHVFLDPARRTSRMNVQFQLSQEET